jgi:hypothetical protein
MNQIDIQIENLIFLSQIPCAEWMSNYVYRYIVHIDTSGSGHKNSEVKSYIYIYMPWIVDLKNILVSICKEKYLLSN